MVVGRGVGTWAPAYFAVPQNPIRGGMGSWAPANFTVPQNPIAAAAAPVMAAALAGLSGLGRLSTALGAWGNAGVGPYYATVADRIMRPIKGTVETGLSGDRGMGAWAPAHFTVPQNPILGGLGSSVANFDVVNHAGSDCHCHGTCSSCQEQAGLGGLGDLTDFSLQDTLGGMSPTTMALIGGGILLLVFLGGRQGGREYKDEVAMAGRAYRKRVQRAKQRHQRRGAVYAQSVKRLVAA